MKGGSEPSSAPLRGHHNTSTLATPRMEPPGTIPGISSGATGDTIKLLETPRKSENDKKEYRSIELPNGIIALLISDLSAGPLLPSPDCEQKKTTAVEPATGQDTADLSSLDLNSETLSAASLTIGVGSFHDPEDIPGLAHFLEHMVFMGSEKYPQENDFDSFIKKQGGYSNACTDRDGTSFYFACQPRYFSTALDKMAQFFIAPLMKREAMQREREAVDSEFNLSLPSDPHRKMQLISSLAKKDHPAYKFACGNVTSLGGGCGDSRDSEIHARLHEFRETHYVGRSMRLAVQSRHHLDTLQRWVLASFSDVQPGPQGISRSEVKGVPDRPFDTPQFTRFYTVQPVRDVSQVQLTWGLPSFLRAYESNPQVYIAWLLEHEGKGGILHHLRDKVWALQISAGSNSTGLDHTSLYMQFGVNVVLTKLGLENLQEVLSTIFSYIALLRVEGPQERLFREVQTILETRFRFTNEGRAVENVSQLSESMHLFPSQHYICGSQLLFRYDPDEIRRCLEFLTPESCNVMLLDKQEGVTYEHAEEWYKTPYNIKDISPEWLNSWKSAQPLPEFHLPEPNPYLADDFSILPPPSGDATLTSPGSTPADPGKVLEDAAPEQLEKDQLGELWFKQDFKYKLPKAHMRFHLISPIPSHSPTNAVLLDLYVTILKLQLTEACYLAGVAQCGSTMSGMGNGLVLKLGGFSQKLHLLLEAILKQMARFEEDLKEEMFAAVQDKQKKHYYNTLLKPSILAQDLNESLLRKGYWSVVDRYSAIDDVTCSQLAEFSRSLRSRLYVRALIQGNLSPSHARSAFSSLRELLQYRPLLPNTAPQLRLARVEVGSRVCRVASYNVDSSNSVVAHTFHCGLASIKDCCIAELVMLQLGEATFNTLRTKEQLGYSVSCHDLVVRGVLHMYVIVNNQEDKHTVDHVDSRIWEHMRSFHGQLEALSTTELEELRQSAMRRKLRADLQLQQEVERHWGEVIAEEYLFHRRQLEHEALSKVTLEEMKDWFQKVALKFENTTQHLSLQVQGHLKVERSPLEEIKSQNENIGDTFSTGSPRLVPGSLTLLIPSVCPVSEPITDLEEYRKSLYYYPVHKVIK